MSEPEQALSCLSQVRLSDDHACRNGQGDATGEPGRHTWILYIFGWKKPQYIITFWDLKSEKKVVNGAYLQCPGHEPGCSHGAQDWKALSGAGRVMVLGPDDGFLGVLCVKCTRIPKASPTQALVLHSGIPVGVLVHRCEFCSQRKWKSSGLGNSVALHNLIAEMTSV